MWRLNRVYRGQVLYKLSMYMALNFYSILKKQRKRDGALLEVKPIACMIPWALAIIVTVSRSIIVRRIPIKAIFTFCQMFFNVNPLDVTFFFIPAGPVIRTHDSDHHCHLHRNRHHDLPRTGCID